MILYLMYAYFYFLVVDWYDNSLPSAQKLIPLFIRARARLIIYLVFLAFKRSWLNFLVAFLVGGVFCIYQPELRLSFLLLMVASALSPYLYYKKHYQYERYLLFLMPLGTLILPQTSGKILLAGGFLVYFAVRLFLGEPIVVFGNSKISFRRYLEKLAIFRVFLVLGFYLILLNITSVKSLPIEQVIAAGILFIASTLEINYSENKKVLEVYRSKFYLNILKKDRPNLEFLSIHQKFMIKNNLLVLIALVLLNSLISGLYLDYFIFLLAVVSFALFHIDIICYQFLMQRSIVYENRVIKTILFTLVAFPVTEYLIFFTALKVAREKKWGNNSFEILTILSRVAVASVSILLIAFFLYRQYRLYKVMTDEEE